MACASLAGTWFNFLQTRFHRSSPRPATGKSLPQSKRFGNWYFSCVSAFSHPLGAAHPLCFAAARPVSRVRPRASSSLPVPAPSSDRPPLWSARATTLPVTYRRFSPESALSVSSPSESLSCSRSCPLPRPPPLLPCWSRQHPHPLDQWYPHCHAHRLVRHPRPWPSLSRKSRVMIMMLRATVSSLSVSSPFSTLLAKIPSIPSTMPWLSASRSRWSPVISLPLRSCCLGLGDHMYPANVLKDGPAPGNKRRSLDEMILDANGFAGLFPDHKSEIVKRLRGLGHLCTSDSPTMPPPCPTRMLVSPSSATNAAHGAANIVLTEPGLSTIIHAIHGSCIISQRMRNCSVYACAVTVHLLRYPCLRLQVQLPPFIVLVIALLNDRTIMTLSVDRVLLSMTPDSWNLTEIFACAMASGLYLALSILGDKLLPG